jgi:antitoxin PrlF
VRDHLKLRRGDRVNFVIQPDGQVLLKPLKIDVRDLAGKFHRKGRKPVSIEDMDAGVLTLFGRRLRTGNR